MLSKNSNFEDLLIELTLKEKSNLTSQEASKVIEIFFSEMTNAFVKEERVEIRGFCSFYMKKYKAYMAGILKLGKNVRYHQRDRHFSNAAKN